jgi:hypothetical protein
MLLVGAGRVKSLALVQIIESSVILAAAWIRMNQAGLTGLLVAMATTIAALTGWLLPWIFHQELRRGQTAPSPALPGSAAAAASSSPVLPLL